MGVVDQLGALDAIEELGVFLDPVTERVRGPDGDRDLNRLLNRDRGLSLEAVPVRARRLRATGVIGGRLVLGGGVVLLSRSPARSARASKPLHDPASRAHLRRELAPDP